MIHSLTKSEHYYVGMTEDLEERLKSHNSGLCKYTANLVPWYIETAVAFKSKERAVAFEKYLKSHSGRAFAEKHF
jgi:predicted GIY-YIG superfamily endonuclease